MASKGLGLLVQKYLAILFWNIIGYVIFLYHIHFIFLNIWLLVNYYAVTFLSGHILSLHSFSDWSIFISTPTQGSEVFTWASNLSSKGKL